MEDGAGAVVCPACGAKVDLAVGGPCPGCGVNTSDPVFREILDADATLYGYKATYDSLIASWVSLSKDRASMLGRLMATRGAADVATAADATPARQGSASPAARAADFASVAPAASVPVERVQPFAAPPARRPKPARTTPRRLTAPALLGVSGASLLIASAIVFIAVTWQTFFPLAQGLIVAAVAVGTAYLALWLKRHDLTTSGGAVGVVAMAFVGVAIIAFNRAGGELGDFAIPLALVFVAGAGLALSRMGILWVGATAALALGAAATGLTWAFSQMDRADAHAVWAILGPILASLTLATYRLWVTVPGRLLLRLGGVALIAVSPIALILDVAGGVRTGPASIAADLAIGALVGFAVPWPRFTLAPASALASAVVAAVAWEQGATQAQMVSALAVTAVIVVAACAFAPATWRYPVLLGLAPAGAAIAATAVVVAVQLLFLLGRAGHVADWLPFSPYSGVAAVIGGVALAAPRLWRPEPGWLRPLSIVGAIFVSVGVTEASYSIAITTAPYQEWAVAVAFIAGGAIVGLSTLLWRSPAGRKVVGVAATILVTIAGLDGAYSLAVRETTIGVCVAVALVPLVALAGFGVRWPRLTLGSAALLVTTLGATLGYLAGDRVFIAIAAGTAVAAVALWLGPRLPAEWRAPVFYGLLPAVALAVGIALLNALPVTASILSGGAYETVWVPDLWTSAITAIGGVALGALRLWDAARRLVGVASIAGSIIVIAAAASATLTASSSWGINAHVGLATIGVVTALAAGAGVALWSTKTARLLNGIGATVLLTIAGIHGAIAFSAPEASPWLGAAVLAIPVAVLALFGRWWPQITLGPAAFLTSTAALSIALHANVPDDAVYAFVAASVLLVAIAVSLAPEEWRRPLLIGAGPAIVVSVAITVPLAILSLTELINPGTVGITWQNATYFTASVAFVVAAAALSPRWNIGKGIEVTTQTIGGLAAPVVAGMGSLIVANTPHRSDVVVPASALLFLLVSAATVAVWSNTVARRAAAIAVVSWWTIIAADVSSTLSRASVGSGQGEWWARLVVVIVAIVALVVVGLRWPAYTLGSASFLASLAVLDVAWHVRPELLPTLFAGAVCASVLAWATFRLRRATSTPVYLGLAPLGAVLGFITLYAALQALILLLSSGSRIAAQVNADPFFGGIVLVVFGGLCSLPWVRDRSRLVPFAAAVAVITAPYLPGHLSWLALVVLVVAAFGAWSSPRLRDWVAGDVVLAVAVGATLLAARWDGALAVAALVGAVAAIVIASRADDGLVTRSLVAAPVFGAFAAGFGVLAIGMPAGVALSAAMIAALAIPIGAAMNGLDPGLVTTPAMVATATAIIPTVHAAPTRSGVALLLAGVGWLALAALHWSLGRWIASAAFSLGTALVLIGAHVTVVEAYTAVPALAALSIGLWWLSDDSEVRTMNALGPGLSIALVPSLIALMADPVNLARTLLLTAATILLAFVGVGMRWFAPILATCVTAVIVSFTQVFASEQIVPRWVSFAIVGSLLIAIAATYEKLKTLR